MTPEAKWKSEWVALREERALARREWRLAVEELSLTARDPLGIAGLVRAHPIASATLGAAAGAVLARMFLSRGEKEPESAARPSSASWSTVLGNAVIQVAVPWILRTLKEKFGWNLDPSTPSEPDTSRPPESNRPVEGGVVSLDR